MAAAGPSTDSDKNNGEPELELTSVPAVTKVSSVRLRLVFLPELSVSGPSSSTVRSNRRGKY